jgi:hypothetical protein
MKLILSLPGLFFFFVTAAYGTEDVVTEVASEPGMVAESSTLTRSSHDRARSSMPPVILNAVKAELEIKLLRADVAVMFIVDDPDYYAMMTGTGGAASGSSFGVVHGMKSAFHTLVVTGDTRGAYGLGFFYITNTITKQSCIVRVEMDLKMTPRSDPAGFQMLGTAKWSPPVFISSDNMLRGFGLLTPEDDLSEESAGKVYRVKQELGR